MKAMRIVGLIFAAGVAVPCARLVAPALAGATSAPVAGRVGAPASAPPVGEVTRLEKTVAEGPTQDRIAAYCRLGELGTAEALAAIARLEAKAATANLTPATVPAAPLATAAGPDGVTYGILAERFFGGHDFFLVSTRTPDDPKSWSRPILLPAPMQDKNNIRDPKLSFPNNSPNARNMVIRLDYGFVDANAPRNGPPTTVPMHFNFQLADVLRDADGDGWTGLEEARLGLDPWKADTDGDGISDGRDSCPDFAAAASPDENTQILTRATFALLCLADSREMLVVMHDSPPIQVLGYGGPIIYRMDLPASQNNAFPNVTRVRWSIGAQRAAADKCSVSIQVIRGAMASIMTEVSMRKIDGQWYATGTRITGGS